MVGIAYAYTPGNSICFLTNPPDSVKDWTFFARTSVNVYLENIGKQYAFVILTSGSESEYYTIPAKALTSSKTFYNFSGMTTTIQWHVFISCSTTPSQIVGHAYR